MDSKDIRRGPGRVRSSAGAASFRLLLAIGASTGLTGAVALPMAYQATQARMPAAETSQRPSETVMGTSQTRPESHIDSTGLRWIPSGGEPVELHEGTISGPGVIVIEADDVVRLDVRIDDGDIFTFDHLPVQVAIDKDALGVPLPPGPHTITATITLDSGVAQVRQAGFTRE